MKVTIFLTGFLLSATTINAYAMSCSKEGGGVSETTLSLKDNGVLTIDFWGTSRNNYYASYIPTECKANRVGKKCIFNKTSDQSTWKDMPKSVSVEFGTLQNVDAVVMQGLFSQESSLNKVIFNPSDCSEYFLYAKGYQALGE